MDKEKKLATKQFNIAKEKVDNLQRLFSLLRNYKTMTALIDKEMVTYVTVIVLPSVGLKAEDFKYCDIDIASGNLIYDIGKKKLEEKLEKEKAQKKGKPKGDKK